MSTDYIEVIKAFNESIEFVEEISPVIAQQIVAIGILESLWIMVIAIVLIGFGVWRYKLFNESVKLHKCQTVGAELVDILGGILGLASTPIVLVYCAKIIFILVAPELYVFTQIVG